MNATPVTGEVLLPEPADLCGALLIVRLRDTTMADAPAPLLGLARRVVSGRQVARLPFSIRLRRPASITPPLSLEAELRATTGRRLAGGDWLTVMDVPCPMPPGSAPVDLPMARV